MIVEIQGIECEKMDKIEETLRLFDLRDADQFREKIVVSADSGEAHRVKTHRLVLGTDGVLVFLREPGELCLTIDGPPPWVFYILGMLDAKHDVATACGVAEIYNETMQKKASRR